MPAIDPDLVVFWETNIIPMLEVLINGRYPLVDIQQHFSANLQMISERCNKPTEYRPQAHAVSKSTKSYVLMACGLEKGSPFIAMYVSTIRTQLQVLQRLLPKTAVEMFETSFVINLLHESDHLAMGQIGGNDIFATTNIECAVWERTCSRVIAPLVEIHHKLLHPSQLEKYTMWKKGHSEFRSYIRKQYRFKVET